ncbi:dipeptide/oligopeptide/nickel ABC transporter permease/ATP-binding protein [Sciscionella marina]|uniref:dipeptide/oligopeptide/nickel ABC transporter permease/ATP-binding protein n=1 Tax=Sciscionella marina TaxID=508770 RepID=UPI0003768B63|nr:dipeptide/oligopeptide/nickel ABC transporter permease/ATP-binding protein [Sciscionella marina]
MRQLTRPLGLTTLVLVSVTLLLAVFGPVLWSARADSIDIDAMRQGMSAAHPFGTDYLGRDVLARTLVATRLSVLLALLATVLGAALGILLGTLPVVLGRRIGGLVVAFINLTVAFPGLLLAIFFGVVFGVGADGAVLALAVALTPNFARLTYTRAVAVAEADFVSAARLLGVPRAVVITRHVVPNIAEPLVVNFASAIGSALLSFAALSYLGFGVQPPSYDWGRLLNEGLPRIYTDPASALLPGFAIVFAGITFVLAGELTARLLTAEPPGHRAAPRETAAPGEPEPGGEHGVLRVVNLRVRFPAANPVCGASFTLHRGEILGLVGESGSGKSVTGAAIAGLVPHPGQVEAERLEFDGEPLDPARLGDRLAMVFQDPMSSLNPALRVGRQLAEVAEVHRNADRRSAMARAVDRLRAVRIRDPERRAAQYPHEFSGGMRQRAMIGMGLMGEPRLIIADEPTTALDVTVQRDILGLLREVRDTQGTAVLFVSHDIAVVRELASRVLVMYAGRIVEELPASALDTAAHPYTRALVASSPDLRTDRSLPLATIEGRAPDATEELPGCPFAPRCSYADERCHTELPAPRDLAGHRVSCWHPIGALEVRA